MFYVAYLAFHRTTVRRCATLDSVTGRGEMQGVGHVVSGVLVKLSINHQVDSHVILVATHSYRLRHGWMVYGAAEQVNRRPRDKQRRRKQQDDG